MIFIIISPGIYLVWFGDRFATLVLKGMSLFRAQKYSIATTGCCSIMITWGLPESIGRLYRRLSFIITVMGKGSIGSLMDTV